MTEANEFEVWTSPDGVAVELRAAPAPPVGPDEDYWFPESPGHLPPRWYHLVAVGTDTVVAEHTVFPVAPWSPYDAISDRLVREGFTPPPLTEAELAECEHGMSAMSCSGPNHFGERYGDEW